MDDFDDNRPISHCKLADIKLITNTEKLLVRITGNVDIANTDQNELSLVDNAEGLERSEVKVSLNNLIDFNLNDMHVQHDLVQFIGSRYFSDEETNECGTIRFRAVFFRFIKRTNLENYLSAVQIQNDYLDRMKKR